MKLLAKTLTCLIISISLSSFINENELIVPEISLKNTNDLETKLSSTRGNIVLIDFWASWCGPCRIKHPELVKTYNQFKDSKFKEAKKFKIFSVSLDNNKDSWLRAIKQDKMDWPNHVSDLKGWKSEVVRTYGIRGIPFNVLIDQNGKVLGTNLHGENLRKALASLQ